MAYEKRRATECRVKLIREREREDAQEEREK